MTVPPKRMLEGGELSCHPYRKSAHIVSIQLNGLAWGEHTCELSIQIKS